ncbi:acyltransferase [Nonomuraea wenchangensis]
MVAAPASTAARTETTRLDWLDALRGLGALAVVGEHLTTWAIPWLRPTAINLGIYGVLVFFLVSGYIIPHSLERHGDVRVFWIGRVFRLYPLYLAAIVLTLALSPWVAVRAEVPRDASAVAAHATMLLDAVGSAGVLNTMWTLSYEMVFYLLAAALFVLGVRDGRGLLPVLPAVAAAVTGLAWAAPPLSGRGCHGCRWPCSPPGWRACSPGGRCAARAWRWGSWRWRCCCSAAGCRGSGRRSWR